jgi:hypothetical protein
VTARREVPLHLIRHRIIESAVFCAESDRDLHRETDGWRGMANWQTVAARGQGYAPSDDVRRVLDELVAEGVLRERWPARDPIPVWRLAREV